MGRVRRLLAEVVVHKALMHARDTFWHVVDLFELSPPLYETVGGM